MNSPRTGSSSAPHEMLDPSAQILAKLEAIEEAQRLISNKQDLLQKSIEELQSSYQDALKRIHQQSEISEGFLVEPLDMQFGNNSSSEQLSGQ